MPEQEAVPVAYQVASLLLQVKGELLLTCPFKEDPGWRLPSCESLNELPQVALASLAQKEFYLYLEPERFDLVHTSAKHEQGVVSTHLFFSVRVWEGYPMLPKQGSGHVRWMRMERISEALPLNVTLALQALDEGLSYSEFVIKPLNKPTLRLVE